MNESEYRLSVRGPDGMPYSIDTSDKEMAKEWLYQTVYKCMANDYSRQAMVTRFFVPEDGK